MESPHPISQRLHAYREYANYLISSPATGVIQVLIDRPHKYNTFTDRMWKDMGKLFRQISQDADFRAVILSATGALGFTAGLDIQEASQETAFNGNTAEDSARRALKIKTYIENFQAQLSEIEKCCKPVICALFATSYGIGVDIACCCDIRLCSEDCVFAVKEIDVGIAADLGTLTRLPKIVGNTAWAKFICLTGTPFKSHEALQRGFVYSVYSDRESCLKGAQVIATLIASKSPVATTGVKAIMNHAQDHTVADSLHYTGVWNAWALQTEDVTKALMSYKTKAHPVFSKL